MLDDLKKLIAIKSVMGSAQDGAPFGSGPKAALDCFLQIARGYGFKVKNENGYCGWAEYGDGDGLIGILGHLDVVPSGDGWSNDPFNLICENGYIYGRGVADDKGPTVAALHALKSIADGKIKLNNRVRLIVGCNEENGSQCIEYYRSHCEIPKASFVPDADFPVINSEKGILHLLVTVPCDGEFKNIASLHAGERPNVVPDLCTVKINKGTPLYGEIAALGNCNDVFSSRKLAKIIVDGGMRISDFCVHFYSDYLIIEARGVAGHAMAPEKGENAAVKAFKLLHGLMPNSSALKTVTDALNEPNPSKLLGIDCADEVSGELTVNLGIAEYDGQELKLTLDLRLPVCADKEKVTQNVQKRLGKVRELRWSPNLYIPKESKLVQSLLAAYTETTGEKGECLYCGGGTYARELPEAVAFGPTFANIETNIHNADERFPLDLFYKLPEIYKAAILKLDKAYS